MKFSVRALLLFYLFQTKIAKDSVSDFIHSNTLPSLILPFVHLLSFIIVDTRCGCLEAADSFHTVQEGGFLQRLRLMSFLSPLTLPPSECSFTPML